MMIVIEPVLRAAPRIFPTGFPKALLVFAMLFAFATGGFCLETDDVLKLMEQRKQQETKEVMIRKAFHDFQFANQIAESGITFKPDITDDVGKHNHPIHYDHGCGLAVADVDGDGLLDIYFVGQLGGNQLWLNQGGGKFKNITESAGVGLTDKVCVGASFADIDNDGDPDLFVTTVRGGNVLFENLGNGRFSNISKDAGVDYVGHSSGAVFFDFNNDGLLDLFVANVGKYTLDKKGRGGAYAGITNSFYGHLYPELGESSLLYQNLGGRRFKVVSPSILSHTAWSGDASFYDVNQDGYPDLYVACMQGDDKFYTNEKGQKFVEKTASYFPKTPWGAMGLKFFDYNNDGMIDLYITDMHSDMTPSQIRLEKSLRRGVELAKSEAFCAFDWTESYLQGSSNNIFGNAFYQGLGKGQFAEVSDQIGVETFWPWGPSAGDLNADGFADLFVTAGMGFPFQYYMNSILLNENGQTFFNAAFVLGVEPRLGGQVEIDYFTLDCDGADKDNPICIGQKGQVTIEGAASSRSSAIFDVDNDGDLDIVTNELLDKPMVLVSNLSKKKNVHFVKVKLQGKRSNRDGLGATVKVTADGLIQTQYVDGKSGYLSQSSIPLYFGLGSLDRVEKIEVLWPSGTRQTVTEVKIGGVVEVAEP
jgi:hypothetical protein